MRWRKNQARPEKHTKELSRDTRPDTTAANSPTEGQHHGQPDAESLESHIDNFIRKLPSPIALLVVDERTREHTWLGYGDERLSIGASLRSGSLAVQRIETLKDIAANADASLGYLHRELKKNNDSHLVGIRSTLGSSLTDELDRRKLPWVRGENALEALMREPRYQRALERDLDQHREEARRRANVTLNALVGASAVYQRDTWKDTHTRRGYFLRELVILEDRRILQVDVSATLETPHKLQHAIVVDDLGTPSGISIEGDTTRIRTSSTQEKEVVIATERGRQTVGYRNVPVTLTLEDPIGPSMLLALVELGCGSVVTQ